MERPAADEVARIEPAPADSTAGETPARRATTKESAAKAAPAKATPAKATPAKAAAAKATPAKKAAKKAAAKKTTVKKAAAKAAPAEKAAKEAAAKATPAGKAPAEAAPATPPASPADQTGTESRTGTEDRARTEDRTRISTPVDVRILDHPAYAPELLALAAVRILGPEADAWVRRTRLDYPTATTHGLARLATRRFVRLAAAGSAAAGAAGLFTPGAALAALAWAQARLVLHLAAAFGEDPTAPDRATDLLVLTGVHRDDVSARDALRAAREVPPAEPGLYRVAEAGWRLAAPLAARAPAWLALRYAARRMPGLLLLAATTAGAADTERLAARATARYRARR